MDKLAVDYHGIGMVKSWPMLFFMEPSGEFKLYFAIAKLPVAGS